MPESQRPATQHRKRPTASLACYECRRKHLKCDGIKPVCARCAATATNCIYLPSRRGLTGRQQQSPEINRWHAGRGHDHPFSSPVSQDAFMDNHRDGSRNPLANATFRAADNSDNSFELLGITRSSFPFFAGERSHLVGLYYSHFHPSHPMLVPRAYFSAQEYPEFLVAAVCLVGQHFASSPTPESALPAVISMAVSSERAENDSRIQAFILLALVSLGSHQMDRANDCLDHAASLAIETRLGGFESCLSDSPPNIKQESLRRTWWELLAVDALLALLQGQPPKITAPDPDALPSVPLPDVLYEVGDLSKRQPTYAEFEHRHFRQQPSEFCSHFYRIEAVLIVRRVQPLFSGDNVDPEELEAVCNDIASWCYHLPGPSFALPHCPEDSDQMLIQAHFLVQVASIFLHFPRSSLPSSTPSAIDATCLGKGLERVEKSTQHSASAIAASRELCHIASFPSLQIGHSPMAVCGFLLGSAVQLSSASSHKTHNPRSSQHYRHRIVLMLGALKQTGKAWSSGLTALHHIQPFADLVFTTVSDHSSEELHTISGSGINATSNPSAECTALERLNGENDHDLNMETTLQENSLDTNWFEFFQSVDPLGELPGYDIA